MESTGRRVRHPVVVLGVPRCEGGIIGFTVNVPTEAFYSIRPHQFSMVETVAASSIDGSYGA